MLKLMLKKRNKKKEEMKYVDGENYSAGVVPSFTTKNESWIKEKWRWNYLWPLP